MRCAVEKLETHNQNWRKEAFSPFAKSLARLMGFYFDLLGQWLNFKLFGITYLVGKIKFKLFFGGHQMKQPLPEK